jgi:hypothetical protein
MRVIISGLPYFGKDLSQKLGNAYPESSFIFLNTYYSKWDQFRFLFLVPFADLVISMNGVTDRSGSLNWVLLWKKKLLMQWQGTDVLLAMERFKNGTLETKYIHHATHFADSDWLEDELKSVGLRPFRQTFKCIEPIERVEEYKQIKAMTYIAEKRQEFYGFKYLTHLAQHFPSIEFTVCGMEKPQDYVPENIHFLGWVNRTVFTEELREHAIFLRLTEHDGYPVSVIEAMSAGAEILMTLPDDNVLLCKTIEQAVEQFGVAMQRIQDRNFKPRHDIAEKTNEIYSAEKILTSYYNKIKSLVQS